MLDAKNTVAAVVTGAVLSATLLLSACGGSAAQSEATDTAETTTEVAETADATAAEGSSVDTFGLTSAWVGMGDGNMTYYYENADQSAGAALIYFTNDNTYERWVGTLEVPAEDQRQVTDAESGETLVFSIVSSDDDGAIHIQTADGFTADMSPSAIDEVGGVLDEVSAYATKVGETPATSDR